MRLVRRAVIMAAVPVAALLVVAQLVLPGVAERRLRDRLQASGQVVHVAVHAVPAVQLLWHDADRVVVRMGSYRSTPAELLSQLAESAGASSVDASATSVDVGAIGLSDATFSKRGGQLTTSARLRDAGLALPGVASVRPVARSDGSLGIHGTVASVGFDASVLAEDGRVVVQSDGPLGGIATVTLIDDPRFYVESVGARQTGGRISLTARARLR